MYYRSVRRDEAPLDKTLLPYRLDAARLERVKKLFFETHYEVTSLPGYDAEVAANTQRDLSLVEDAGLRGTL